MTGLASLGTRVQERKDSLSGAVPWPCLVSKCVQLVTLCCACHSAQAGRGACVAQPGAHVNSLTRAC